MSYSPTCTDLIMPASHAVNISQNLTNQKSRQLPDEIYDEIISFLWNDLSSLCKGLRLRPCPSSSGPTIAETTILLHCPMWLLPRCRCLGSIWRERIDASGNPFWFLLAPVLEMLSGCEAMAKLSRCRPGLVLNREVSTTGLFLGCVYRC